MPISNNQISRDKTAAILKELAEKFKKVASTFVGYEGLIRSWGVNAIDKKNAALIYEDLVTSSEALKTLASPGVKNLTHEEIIDNIRKNLNSYKEQAKRIEFKSLILCTLETFEKHVKSIPEEVVLKAVVEAVPEAILNEPVNVLSVMR